MITDNDEFNGIRIISIRKLLVRHLKLGLLRVNEHTDSGQHVVRLSRDTMLRRRPRRRSRRRRGTAVAVGRSGRDSNAILAGHAQLVPVLASFHAERRDTRRTTVELVSGGRCCCCNDTTATAGRRFRANRTAPITVVASGQRCSRRRRGGGGGNAVMLLLQWRWRVQPLGRAHGNTTARTHCRRGHGHVSQQAVEVVLLLLVMVCGELVVRLLRRLRVVHMLLRLLLVRGRAATA